MKLFHFVGGIALLAIGIAVGLWWANRPSPKPDANLETLAPMVQTKVVAQGRILPVSGLINLFAPPNQRIETILVKEGETVAANAELASFSGQATLELQSDMVDSQGEDAKRELAQKILAAEGNRLAARNGVSAAQLQLEQIENEDSLSSAERQLEAARNKLKKLESLAKDPATQLYVSEVNLTDQRNQIAQSESQLRQATQKRENGLTAGRLNLELAQATLGQAEAALRSLKELEQQNRTLHLSKTIAETTKRNAKLFAPIAATVLKVNGKPGEVVLQAPLMQLGDLTKLVCTAEVIDRLVHHVKEGQRATITSPSLSKPVPGKVISIGRIVGTGILNDPNPLTVMDRKTVEVKIELDLSDEEIAKQLINLQVTVEIKVEPEIDRPNPK